MMTIVAKVMIITTGITTCAYALCTLFASVSVHHAEKSRRDYVAPEFKDVEIFDYHHIKEGELLGSGQYGEVFKGEAKLQGKDQWTVVAIKKPKSENFCILAKFLTWEFNEIYCPDCHQSKSDSTTECRVRTYT